MAKKISKNIKDHLEKCKSSAIAAVTCYNSPALSFKSPLFIILIIISWTAFFHAYFYRKGIKPWHKNKKGTRYEYNKQREPIYWELSKCLIEYFKDKNPPEKDNLEFLIGLRNKIEHKDMPEIDANLYGECQACLMNLEDMLVSEFGSHHALSKNLNISLQFSRIIPAEKRNSYKSLAAREVKNVREYIEKFRKELDSHILDDQRYSFNVFLVPKVVGRESASDIAVEFINAKNLTEDELARYKKLNVLIKEKKVPIVNQDLYKPSEVIAKLKKEVPFKISMNTHSSAWKYFKIRPSSDHIDKTKTDPRYCHYDRSHNDYLYTEAWVEKLKAEFSSEKKFIKITGRRPTKK